MTKLKNLKILYITPSGIKKGKYNEEDTYDFLSITTIIKKGILNVFPRYTIDFPKDCVTKNGDIPRDIIDSYDLCLCDLTTINASISYTVGVADGLGKPIIYFSTTDTYVIPAIRRKIFLRYSQASLKSDFLEELNGWLEVAGKDINGFNTNKKENNRDKEFSKLPVRQ